MNFIQDKYNNKEAIPIAINLLSGSESKAEKNLKFKFLQVKKQTEKKRKWRKFAFK